MSLADIMTQIPASIHGQIGRCETVRSVVCRCYTVQRVERGTERITNIDDDVVPPFATALYV